MSFYEKSRQLLQTFHTDVNVSFPFGSKRGILTQERAISFDYALDDGRQMIQRNFTSKNVVVNQNQVSGLCLRQRRQHSFTEILNLGLMPNLVGTRENDLLLLLPMGLQLKTDVPDTDAEVNQPLRGDRCIRTIGEDVTKRLLNDLTVDRRDVTKWAGPIILNDLLHRFERLGEFGTERFIHCGTDNDTFLSKVKNSFLV